MISIKLAMIGAMAWTALAAGDAKHEAAEEKTRAVAGAPSKGLAACHDDIEKHCAGVKPGGGRIGACLAANKKKLSKGCMRWAGHGGKGHEEASLKEIDKSAEPAKARP